MAKALVSPNEKVYRATGMATKHRVNEDTGEVETYKVPITAEIENSARIVQTVTADNDQFAVAPPLNWISVAANVKPETHYFNTATNSVAAL